MKILYISKADISKTNGPGINERGFIPLLYKLLGKNAHFLIPKPTGKIPNNIPLEAVTFFKSSYGRKPIPWIKQQRSLTKEANKLLRDADFDLMVIRPEIFDFALNKIVKKHQTPYALKTAGSGKFKVFKRKNFLLRILFDLNQKQYLKLVQGAILVDVVSNIQKDSLRNLTEESQKIYWIDNGVNIDQFKPIDKSIIRKEMKLDQFFPIIGYAGNLPWKRGAMQMVEALPRLIEKYPNIGMVSLGSGNGMNELYAKAKELEVKDHCVFTGQVPFEDVPKYINCMDVGVSQLYKDEQGASEQKVRQYMACGRPLIVSPGGVNDFVPDNGFGYIVDPLDEDEFFEKVVKLLELRENELNDLSKKIREYAVKNLSYESRVKERLTLYKEHLNK